MRCLQATVLPTDIIKGAYQDNRWCGRFPRKVVPCLTYTLTCVHLALRLMGNLAPLNKHYLLDPSTSKETGLQTKRDILHMLRLDHCSSGLTEAVGEECVVRVAEG